MSGPEIAVVIPTHQRRKLLLRLLASLAAQRLDPARFEVAVVCDGCTDGTASAALGLYGPTLAAGINLLAIEQPRSGAASARNSGTRRTTAPLLLFLDDDMVAEPDLLQRHLRAHRTAPGSVVLGAVPVHPDSPRSFLTVGLAQWATRRHERLRSSAAVPPDVVLSGHMSVSRLVFDRLGGFDPAFTAGGTVGGEDLDFGWRARLRGIAVRYEGTAVARQVYVKSFASLACNIRDGALADLELARRHPELRPWLLLGRVEELGPVQRRVLKASLRGSAVLRAIGGVAVKALDVAVRWGGTGVLLEAAHAVVRAHLYGAALAESGGLPTPVVPGESRSARAITA